MFCSFECAQIDPALKSIARSDRSGAQIDRHPPWLQLPGFQNRETKLPEVSNMGVFERFLSSAALHPREGFDFT